MVEKFSSNNSSSAAVETVKTKVETVKTEVKTAEKKEPEDYFFRNLTTRGDKTSRYPMLTDLSLLV